MKKADRENINPTPAAVAAMYIYCNDYAAQKGGSMDFWKLLPPWKQKVCADLVKDIEAAFMMTERERERKTGIYGDDMTRPIEDILGEVRSSLVRSRGRLSDVGFEHKGMRERLMAAEGGLTCCIVTLYNDIEEVKKWEHPRASGEEKSR